MQIKLTLKLKQKLIHTAKKLTIEMCDILQ